MANFNEPVQYRVYVWDSTGAGTDASAYVQPDYQSARMLAEARLFQFEAGDLTFNFIDRDTDKAHRYWSDRIAQTDSYTYGGKTLDWPMIQVYDPADSTAPLYVGFIDKRFMTWEGDCISSFRALSMLAYADTIDARPARNGEAGIDTYSGLADALARTMLLKLGNAAPGATADVDIKDMLLGSAQADTDWNHVRRTWADAGADANTDHYLSEYVPVVSGSQLGFVCIHGKLYRVTTAARGGVDLTRITVLPDGEDEAISTGSRLFYFSRYVGPSNWQPCLAIVQGEWRSLYTHQFEPWNNPVVSTGVAAGSLVGALAAAKTHPGLALFAPMAAAQINASLGQMLGRHTATATDQKRQTIRVVHIMSIGDGTNDPSTGVGASFNATVPTNIIPNMTLGVTSNYVPVDSICVSSPVSKQSSYIYIARYAASAGVTHVVRISLGGTTFRASSVLPTIQGEPQGGMAAREMVVLIGTSNGYALRRDGNTSLHKDILKSRPPGRFVASIPSSDAGHVLFLLSDNSSDYVRVNTATLATLTGPIQPAPGENLPDGFKVVVANPYAQVTTVKGTTIIYRALDSIGTEYLYAGWLYETGGYLYFSEDNNFCTYPLPAARQSDLRPPLLYYDETQSVYRVLVAGAQVQGDRLVVDQWYSSLYAVARVHWDFAQNPLSIRQVIEGIAHSFYCYLKLYDLDAPSSSSEVKIMSRHGYTPTDAGDISRAEIEANPRVEGIEWYDGVEANVMGERVTSGDIGIGRQSFRLGGLFLTPNWARGMGTRIVNNYPVKSSSNPTYPNGRRIFTFNLRRIEQTSNVFVLPGYYHLYRTVDLSLFTDSGFSGVKALILSMGYNRTTGIHSMSCIEWDDYDVDWASNESAASPTSVNQADETITDIAPGFVDSERTFVGWVIHPDIVSGGVSNPNSYPCAYAYKVDLHKGLALSHYLYGLSGDGSDTEAALWVAVWRDSGGIDSYPLERIDQTMALIVNSGRSKGPFYQELNYYLADTSGGDTSGILDTSLVTTSARLRDPYLDSYYLAPGVYWVVVVQDGSAIASTPANIEWWDGGMAGMGAAWRMSFIGGTTGVDTSGGLEFGTWIANWAPELAERSQYAPAIYLGGEI